MINWWLITIFAAGCFAAVAIRRVLIGDWWRHLFAVLLVLAVSGQASAEYNPPTATLTVGVGFTANPGPATDDGAVRTKTFIGYTTESDGAWWWGTSVGGSWTSFPNNGISFTWWGWNYLGHEEDVGYWWGTTVSKYYPATNGGFPHSSMTAYAMLSEAQDTITVYRDGQVEVLSFMNFNAGTTGTFSAQWGSSSIASITAQLGAMPGQPTTRPAFGIATSQPVTPTQLEIQDTLEDMLDEVQAFGGPTDLVELMTEWKAVILDVQELIDFPAAEADFFTSLKNYLITRELKTEFGIIPPGAEAGHKLTFDYREVLDQVSARWVPLLTGAGLIKKLAGIVRATLVMLLYFWCLLKFYRIAQRAFGTVAHVHIVN